MSRSVLRTTVGVLDAFTATTAVVGGVLLATGREDERFPTTALRRTPFSDYVVPGWLLGTCVGGTAGLAALATIRSARAGGSASAVAGLVLVGWTVGTEIVLDLPRGTTTDRATDALYLTIGAAMAVIGIALRQTSSPRPRLTRLRA